MDDQGVDNTLKYELYLSKQPNDKLVERYKNYLSTLVKDDESTHFDLEAHPTQNLCTGSLKFDYNIEQEWLVVYLLFELSKFDQDLVIKVRDNDGDILLIEAAEHLPKWLESSESENRVFIHNGQLHIIPKHVNLNELHLPATSPTTTVAHSAAMCIRDQPAVNTLAGSSIQNAIKKQLCGLPDKKAWLTKKFKQLDEIISVKDFNESLTLASVMNMPDEDLEISPISSKPSTTVSSSVTSLSSQSSSSAASSYDSSSPSTSTSSSEQRLAPSND